LPLAVALPARSLIGDPPGWLHPVQVRAGIAVCANGPRLAGVSLGAYGFALA